MQHEIDERFLQAIQSHKIRLDTDDLTRSIPNYSKDEYNPREIVNQSRYQERCYFSIAGVRHPYSNFESSSLFLGATGSGKTLLMGDSLRAAGEALKHAPGCIIGFDYKGDMYGICEAMARSAQVPFYYINPGDVRSVRVHLGKDIQNDFLLAKELAETLVPIDSKAEPFWGRAAQQLVLAPMNVFIQKAGTRWGLHDVYNCALANDDILQDFLTQSPNNRAIVDILLNSSADKMRDSIRGSLLVQLYSMLVPACFEYWSAQSKNPPPRISLREVITTPCIILFGQNNDRLASTSPFMRACFLLIAKALLSKPTVPSTPSHFHTSFFIDEFPEYGNLPLLTTLLSTGRSRKVSLYLAAQDFNQIKSMYPELVFTILQNTDFKVYMRSNDINDAQEKSRQLGTVQRPQRSRSKTGHRRTESVHLVDEPLYRPEFFLNMPKVSATTPIPFIMRSPYEGFIVRQRSITLEDILTRQPPTTNNNTPRPVPNSFFNFPFWNPSEKVFLPPSVEQLKSDFIGVNANAFQKKVRSEVFHALERTLNQKIEQHLQGRGM